MKPTENYEQLIARFEKRSSDLIQRQAALYKAYSEYVKIDDDLRRLEGSLQVAKYLAYGTLPDDGNHDGMKDHTPQ